MAAQLIAITPSGLRVILKSTRMRPSTGSAVIENAVATNKTKPSRLSLPAISRGMTAPSAAPIANGAASPAPATAQTTRR